MGNVSKNLRHSIFYSSFTNSQFYASFSSAVRESLIRLWDRGHQACNFVEVQMQKVIIA